MTCSVDTGAAPDQTNEDDLKPQRNCCDERLESFKLRTATKAAIITEGTIPLIVQVEELPV